VLFLLPPPAPIYKYLVHSARVLGLALRALQIRRDVDHLALHCLELPLVPENKPFEACPLLIELLDHAVLLLDGLFQGLVTEMRRRGVRICGAD
jgi:hypothetical protein